MQRRKVPGMGEFLFSISKEKEYFYLLFRN